MEVYVNHFLFLCILFFSECYGTDADDNSSCIFNNIVGKCIHASSCLENASSIKENRYHGLERCGFRERTEIVCCPYKSIDLILENTSCHSVNEQCVNANHCSEVKRSADQKRKHNLQRCGFNGTTELVCCPNEMVNIEPSLNDRFNTIGTRHASQRKSVKECELYRQMAESNSRKSLTTYILNGQDVLDGEYPHMASLKVKDGSVLKTFCGGSLISKRHVLTAAHCLKQSLGGLSLPEIIQLGITNISDVGDTKVTTYKIKKYFIHPEYKRTLQYHDIAIIQLDREVIMGDEIHKIFPACLNSDKDRPVFNETLIITGWGKTNYKEDYGSEVLMKTEVFIPEREKCLIQKGRRLPRGIIDEQLCALGYKNSQGIRGDTCGGDSGGPLLSCEYQGCLPATIFGVTSFGFQCGFDKPGYYTHVFKYLDWIEGIVWGNNL